MKAVTPDIMKQAIGTDKSSKDEVYTPTLNNDILFKKSISNIPRRYKAALFEAKTDEQQKLIDKFRSNFNGKNIHDVSDMLIVGTVGTGKTYITIGLLNKLLEANIYCRYSTEYDLLNLYFMKKYDKFNQFKSTDVLVIDELGKRDLQDWQMIQIEELLSYRYNEQLPTILITNRNKEKFKEFVGDRIVDRLKDNKVITVALTGESLRGNI